MNKPRKRFGQNFLKDEQIIARILDVIQPKETDLIVEIGPGLGALTRPLLNKINHLDVIEIDRDLAALLENEFKDSKKLTVHVMDVLKFDFAELSSHQGSLNSAIHNSGIHPKGTKLRIVGNLPYNISTPVIFTLLDASEKAIIQDMHFMLQKEVVDRMTAKPHEKSYGRLSVMVQYFCEPQFLFNVGREAFRPPPKVSSAFIRLVPFDVLPHQAKNFDLFKEMVNAAFQQRRKTIQNSLKSYLTKEDFQQLQIDPSRRPETLSIGEFVEISNWIYSKE